MGEFREFIRRDETEASWHRYEADDCVVWLCFESNRLDEAQHRGRPLGGKYSAIKHTAHIPDGKVHLHVYEKNNQLFALNIDGTAHDQSHGVTIPNKVAAAIKADFPQFTIPANNFIDAASGQHRDDGTIRWITESME